MYQQPDQTPPRLPIQPVYQQPAYGPPVGAQQVSKTGISAMGIGVHLLLTFFTCGCWGIVWFLHWLMTQQKTVTTTRPY